MSSFSVDGVCALAPALEEAIAAGAPAGGETARYAGADAAWWWASEFASTGEPAVRAVLGDMHMVGLFLARARTHCGGGHDDAPPAFLAALESGDAFRGVRGLGLKEFHLLVQCVQLKFRGLLYGGRVGPGDIMQALLCMLEQTGHFAGLDDSAAEARVLNDVSLTEEVGSSGRVVATLQSTRRALTVVHVLMGHLRLHAVAVPPPPELGAACAALVMDHHVEAGMQDYYQLAMEWDCMPGARVLYTLDFPGLYNDISQVVYFHNPQYERRPPATLAAARAGGCAVSALPAILQLYPEVALVLEGTAAIGASMRGGAFRWLVSPGSVYLVTGGGVAYTHANVFALLAAYRASLGGPA